MPSTTESEIVDQCIEEVYTGDIDEYLEGDDACEVVDLDEAMLTKKYPDIKFPPKENRHMILKVKVGQADIINGNGRYYPRDILENQVNIIRKKIRNSKNVFSNDQHPRRKVGADNKVEMIDQPNFASTTFIPYDIWMDESGGVYSIGGIPKTTAGDNFAAVIRAGGRPGISTRGSGTSKKQLVKVQNEQKEAKVIQGDYKLKTYDTVIDQSVSDAKIVDIMESHQVPEVIPNKVSDQIVIMKLNDWIAKYPEAQKSLAESIEEGSITLDNIKSLSKSLFENLRASICESVESEIQKKLLTKYDKYLDGIRESLTEGELDNARAEGVALMFQELGLNKDEATALVENEQLLPLLKVVVEEIQNPGNEEVAPGNETQPAVLTQEALEEAIGGSKIVKDLKESLEKANASLVTSKRDAAISECRGNFPYNMEVFDKNIKPILENLDTEEEVKSVYESQIDMLKSAGVKETKRGSAQFLAKDTQVNEELADNQNKNEEKSLDEQLLEEAAESFGNVPPVQTKEVALIHTGK